MKKFLILILAVAASASMAQSHSRAGYVTKDGTYVAPSHATNPNSTKLDNYSTKGNVNPYTGEPGKVDPYKQPEPFKPTTVTPPQQPSPYSYPAYGTVPKKSF